MFNNAQMVEIGGKEVKSIVLQDGGVLYEITDTEVLHLTSDKESIKKNETAILTASLLPKKENEIIYINKIISDENLNLELTSIDNGASHMIKAKITDENGNGLENIRIKLYKEE